MSGPLGSDKLRKILVNMELPKEYFCGNQFHLEGKLLAFIVEIPPRVHSDAPRIDNAICFRKWNGSGEAPSRSMTRRDSMSLSNSMMIPSSHQEFQNHFKSIFIVPLLAHHSKPILINQRPRWQIVWPN